MSANILIVDDETNVRLNYRVTLETEGYQIFEAVSGAERWRNCWADRLTWRSWICGCRGWMAWSCWPKCGKSASPFRR